MKTKHLSYLLVLFFVLPGMAPSVTGQPAPDRQAKQKVSIHLKQKPLCDVVWTLIQKYDVAIGFEESVLDREHRNYEFGIDRAVDEASLEEFSEKVVRPGNLVFDDNFITVDFEEAELGAVLDSIVSQMKNYAWEINDGVVNIYPTAGRDERLKKLMDIRIRRFYLGLDDSEILIQPRLSLSLPEYKSFLKDNNLIAETAQWGTFFSAHKFPDGLVLENLTFRELLNRLTKLKRGGWAVKIKNQPDKPGMEFVEIVI